MNIPSKPNIDKEMKNKIILDLFKS